MYRVYSKEADVQNDELKSNAWGILPIGNYPRNTDR